jgi:hypothetical protein
MRLFLLVLLLSALATAGFIGGLLAWSGWAMGRHLWIALGLGTFLSLALGGGLMTLVFHSARHGYDDRIELDPEGEPD